MSTTGPGSEFPLPPNKLVLSRPDRIGDVVISTSCLRPIREAFPKTRIYFIVERKLAPLLSEHPLIERAILLDSEENAEVAGLQISSELGRLDAECIVHLHQHPIVSEAAANAGIPVRIGFSSHNRRSLLTHSVRIDKKECDCHEAAYNFQLLHELGLEPPPLLAPSIKLPEINEDQFFGEVPFPDRGREYFAFHLAAHSRKPRLPMSCFAAAGAWLLRHYPGDLLIVGAEGDDASTREFISHLRDHAHRIFDLTGKTNLAELGFILKRARLMLSRDSGPAHLAAALGCPTVCVVGPVARKRAATRWQPLGPRVTVVEPPVSPRFLEPIGRFQRRFFDSVSEEMLTEAMKQQLCSPP